MFSEPLQIIQFHDKYAKYLPELKRRETWAEAVDRVINFFKSQTPLKADDPIWLELHQAMLEGSVMPSMRILQMAGPTLEKCHVGAYNCAYVPLDSAQSFAELLYILMQGTGCGFSVEGRYVSQWSPVAEKYTQSRTVHYIIEDDTEGWCDAFYECINYAIQGFEDVQFDYSHIRPKGTRLKTKGGYASGPEPLRKLLETTTSIIRARSGSRLSSFDLHRIATLAGEIVQVGGIRRSAQISLSDLGDVEMRDCKRGQFWEKYPELSQANNSAVYNQKPTWAEFLKEWLALQTSGTGERGIFNRQQFIYRAKDDFGTNPCFAKGTLIETTEGRIPIEQLTTESWVYTRLEDGTLGIARASASWKTKSSEVLTVKVGNYELSVTPDHLIYVEGRGWIESGLLKKGDRLCVILRQRRGAAYTGVKLSSESEWRMEHRMVWEEMYGPLPEGWDVHHENNDGHDNRLSNLRPLPHAHHSYVTAHEQANDHQIKGEGGRFVGDGVAVKTIVPLPAHLKAGIHQYPTIESITRGPVVDVYDLKVEGTHNVIANGIVAHNCGEIILRPRQFCNLSIAVVRSTDTEADLRRKVELATIFGTLQSCLTKFNYISSKWKENCEEERLLGVDLMGTMDNTLLSYPHPEARLVLDRLRVLAHQTNAEWADKLGIEQSAAITCNKPSGNSSVLLGTASGIHPRYAQYYVRRLRITAGTPLSEYLISAGVPWAPEGTTCVFEFPVKSPNGAVTRDKRTAIEQFRYWLMFKRHWTDHNPSCTIYVDDDEWDQLAMAVYADWHLVGGLSFLPKDNHIYPLMPYQEIGATEYWERMEQFPQLDLSQIIEGEDLTTRGQDFACVSGICDI